ncbi:sulfonate biosynthesis enzyme [Biscogniauxia mediterranea]|nr:sulfonate biosynthesis enzyme [Biscogniauxia mediterranea]
MSAPSRPLFTTALRSARARTPITTSTYAQPLSRALRTTTAALSQPPRDSGAKGNSSKILLEDADAGFAFARHNPLPAKPRSRSVTEIRGPYYTAMGRRYLADVLETMGAHVDGVKFAGGSFSLFPEAALRELVDLAHAHGAYVSTGGWVEHVLAAGGGDGVAAVDAYLDRVRGLGFDVVELSAGFLSLPADDWLRLVGRVQDKGLAPKPELGIQFGAGGDTAAAELAATGTSDPAKVINMARRFIDAGVERMMIESEGITENVQAWRTDVIQAILRELPMEKVMFEAADPAVFNWYIREFGVDVNLFVDHSQIVQLAGLRAGIWGKSDTFGKITTFRPPGSV